MILQKLNMINFENLVFLPERDKYKVNLFKGVNPLNLLKDGVLFKTSGVSIWRFLKNLLKLESDTPFRRLLIL